MNVHLKIKGLFGRFDYEFDLFQQGERVSILTGPNGFGKSTILRCIRAVGESDLSFFNDLPVDSFEISSETGSFSIQKQGESVYINGDKMGKKAVESLVSDYKRIFREPGGFINLRLNEISDTSPFSDFGKAYWDYLEHSEPERKNIFIQNITELQSMVQCVGKTRLIEEQRIITIQNREAGKQRVRQVIDGISESMKGIISRYANEYSQKSTELDADLPNRLLNQSELPSLSREEFDQRNERMQKNLASLRDNGISGAQTPPALSFSEDNARILRILLDNFNEKYEVYRPLMEKLSLFKEIVNERIKFKRVVISSEQELLIEDADSGKPLPLQKLSSGEKEILILFYRMIFETEPGVTLLIDEPEISLHLAWQMPFVRDLQRIAELNKIRAVIATHSSGIINGHRNIQIDLGERYQYGRQKHT